MQTGDELLDNAASLAETGSFEEAAVLYQQFLRGTPRHFEALKALGMIYFQMGQMDKAQYLLGEALRLDPLGKGAVGMREVVDGRQVHAHRVTVVDQFLHQSEVLPRGREHCRLTARITGRAPV